VVATAQVLEVEASAQVQRHLLAKLGHLSNVEHTVVVDLVSHLILAACARGGEAQLWLGAGGHLNAVAAEVLVVWECDVHGEVADQWVHDVVGRPRALSAALHSVDTERDWRHTAVRGIECARDSDNVVLETGVNGGVEIDFGGGANVGTDVHVGLVVSVVELDLAQVQAGGSVEAVAVGGGEAWNLLNVEVDALADGVLMVVSDVQVVASGLKAPLDLFGTSGIAGVELEVGTAGHLTLVGIADRALAVVVIEKTGAIGTEIVESWWRHSV